MRRFAPLIALALFGCEDIAEPTDSTSPTTDQAELGIVAGNVFDGEATPQGEFAVALATGAGDSFTIEAVVAVDADQLPYAYEFQGVEKGVEYRLVAIDADLQIDLGQFGLDELVAATVDTVQIPVAEERVDGINLAL